MDALDPTELATLIALRIAAAAPALAEAFARHGPEGAACASLDVLLPPALFAQLLGALPPRAAMIRRRSLGERKYVFAETARMAPSLAALIHAFATDRVAAALADAVAMPALSPDPELYNGGITIMAPGDFMRPHLDNSHDRAGRRERRLVLLYYLAPEWQPGWNGSLQLWAEPGRTIPRMIAYRPNRLVLMSANDASWHSVARIEGPADRINLTAYYYAPAPTGSRVRLTRFAGWPSEPAIGAVLGAQFHARSMAERLGLRRFVRNPHRTTGQTPPAI